MRAITLWQPWASLVAFHLKWVETRSRPWPWDGAVGQTIGVHAAVRIPKEGPVAGGRVMRDMTGALMFQLDEPFTEEQQVAAGLPADGDLHGFPLPLGHMLATVTLEAVVPIVNDGLARNCVDVRPDMNGGVGLRLDDATGKEHVMDISDQVKAGDFTPGRTALVFGAIDTFLEPVPVLGAQGVWTWDR